MFGGQSGQMGVALADEVYELTIAQENDPKQWTELDVANWLEKMGCNQYVETFKQNLVNGELLLTLTENDLAAHLGVSKYRFNSPLIGKSNAKIYSTTIT